MIFCKDLDKSFESKQLMFKELQENKQHLISLKKSAIKYTDGFDYLYMDKETKNGVVKSNDMVSGDMTELKVRVVMNTTNVLDSHGDVHIDGLWKRTLSHSNKKLHLQEHLREFDKVISSDALAYVKNTTFKDLGFSFDGNTQALIFDSLVKMSRNPLMFQQYKNGWVNNHSVGMQYVDIVICINSEERWAAEEKENWDKYYPLIMNKDDADASGYFWAVLEAKLAEGSAVLMGSNWITPTLENNMKSANAPSKNDPLKGTQMLKELNNLLEKFKN